MNRCKQAATGMQEDLLHRRTHTEREREREMDMDAFVVVLVLSMVLLVGCACTIGYTSYVITRVGIEPQ